MGLSNTLATVPGILAPAAVGWFTAIEVSKQLDTKTRIQDVETIFQSVG